MANSYLTKKLMPADKSNYTAGRKTAVTEITIHHTADIITLEQLGKLWQNPTRDGSSTYGVKDHDVYCYVSEGDTPWTNSNWESNCRAVTIETVNDGVAPDWHVSDASIVTLTKLVADIANRKGLGELVVGENLTYHSMYKNTVCPGPYLFSKLQFIADVANAINGTWIQSDKLLSPITNKCEFFNSPNVNDVAGKLPQETVYEVIGTWPKAIGGFDWAKIKMADGEYFVALLDDRCVLQSTATECALCHEVEKLKKQVENLAVEKQSAEEALNRETTRAEEYHKQLEITNNALAAERAVNSSYSKENAELKEKLAKIKNIVGG